MPPDYKGSLIFRELLFLLRNSLVSLGKDCVIKPNRLSEDRVNIVVGYHLIKYGDYLKKFRYIPFQLEQLSAEGGWYNENVRLLLQGAEDVWDYSLRNIGFLRELGIEAKYLPIGYHESLETIRPAEQRDIDILFYGTMNERRKKIIKSLKTIPRAKAVTLEALYGEERDAYIARSKIVLNMHYYETGILESVRVSYLLNNGCFVVTEECSDNPYKELGIPEAASEELATVCRHYLENEAEREELRKTTYERFKTEFRMTELVSKVV